MSDTQVKPALYDAAAFHLGSPAFSTSRLNPENSGTHIGMYLAWIIISRLESFALRQAAATAVEEVRGKQLTGREFLFAHCDGKLTSDALNKEAQAFTESYYVDEYLEDFDQVLVSKANGTYTVVDSWANYDRIAVVIDRRLRDFRSSKPTATS